MARIIRALLDALNGDDDDDDGTVSSLSSGASSPSRLVFAPDALVAPPRVVTRLSSSSSTDDRTELGDEVLEEVSNGFFRIARVPRLSDEGPTSLGEEKPAARGASASESEYFGAAVEGSSDEGFPGASSFDVDVFHAGASGGLEDAAAAGVSVGDKVVAVEDSWDGSLQSSGSVLVPASIGGSVNLPDGSVTKDGEHGERDVAAKAVSFVVPESFIGYTGDIDGGVMRSADALEEKVEESELEVTEFPLVVDSSEDDAGFVLPDDDSDAKDNISKDEVVTYVEDVSLGHVAGDDSDAKDNTSEHTYVEDNSLGHVAGDDSDAKDITSKHEVVTYVEGVSLGHVAGDDSDAKDNTSKHEVVAYVEDVSLGCVGGDDSDAKDNTSKHEVVTYVEDDSLGHVAGDKYDAKDNPYSITDCGHDKVDGEIHGDYEASASVPIFETNNAVELLGKELVDELSSFEEICFDLDDFDGNHVNDDDGEEKLFLRNDDEEGLNRKEVDLSDYATLAELLSAPNRSHGQGKAKVFPVEISDSKQLPPTVVNTCRTNMATTSVLKVAAYPKSDMTDEEKQLYRKVDITRIKYLRLVHRLGYDTEHRAPIEVLHRLSIVEGLRRIRTSNHSAELDNAWKRALQLEADGIEDLEFSCNVLILGKTGVGKSATINSIFGEGRSKTNAFLPATSSVKEITGVVGGVKFRVVDTPGLRTSIMDEKLNKKVLRSVKTYIKRCPPDIVLYIDRIDTQRQDADDQFLLRVITSVLGLSIWSKTIITLTHSAAPPPEGPDGFQLNYEMFVTHRAHALQQSILQATKDTRIQNRVALVENHHLCQRNSEGEKVLPDGTIWRRQLLLWCYSLKIVSEVDSLSTRRGASASLFSPALPIALLPCFLSSLMKSREHHKRACHPDDEPDTDRSPIQALALPSSFDSDDPVYRYRCLEPTLNLLVSSDPNPGMWDHDCGFDIVCLQHNIDVANTFPASMSIQVNKDKKEFTIHMESSISVKHGGHASSLAGFDIQTMMDQFAYTLRGETKFKNFKKNTTTGGLSMTFLGDTMVTGTKFEDKLSVGNWLTLVANTGAVTMKGDTAYGVNMEVNLCEKDYSVGQVLATLGASLVRWHREWTVAANLDSQFSMGRRSSMTFHLDLNNKLTGRVGIKANTSEQLTIAALGICTTAMHLWKRIHPNCE